jgi:uncharacterized protein YuzE
VTYHGGRPFAAYYSLPKRRVERVHRSRPVGDSVVIDFDRRGGVFGVEIVNPELVTFDSLNAVLRDVGVPTLTRAEFRPLHVGSTSRARARQRSRSRTLSRRRRISA